MDTIPQTFEIQSGKVDSKWEQYGLNQVDIKLRDLDTPYKMIVEDGQPIAITSKKYVLIPNQIVLEAADSVAQKLGAVPFINFKGEWFNKPKDHVMMNAEKTRITALYGFNEPVEITPGDKIQLGFSIRNGIDGGSSFGIGMFTFRHACSNMFIMARMKVGQGMGFDDRSVISKFDTMHQGEGAEMMASVDAIVPIVKQVIQSGTKVVDLLRTMATTKITQEKAFQLMSLPVKYLDKISGFEVAGGKAGKKAEVKYTGDVTEYQAWNDITALLTHDEKGGYGTKMMHFATVQQVFFPKERKQ